MPDSHQTLLSVWLSYGLVSRSILNQDSSILGIPRSGSLRLYSLIMYLAPHFIALYPRHRLGGQGFNSLQNNQDDAEQVYMPRTSTYRYQGLVWRPRMGCNKKGYEARIDVQNSVALNLTRLATRVLSPSTVLHKREREAGQLCLGGVRSSS